MKSRSALMAMVSALASSLALGERIDLLGPKDCQAIKRVARGQAPQSFARGRFPRKLQARSCYQPHQGARERFRRIRQRGDYFDVSKVVWEA